MTEIKINYNNGYEAKYLIAESKNEVFETIKALIRSRMEELK